MKVYLLHGYNVHNADETVGQCEPVLRAMGYDPHTIEYGHVGLFELRPRNETAAKMLPSIVKPGDVLITHSNGAAIAYESALEDNLKGLAALIMFNPALDENIKFPNATAERIVVAINKTDTPVLGGRLWRKITKYSPFSIEYGKHLWGAAGRLGFKRREHYTAHIEMSDGPHAAEGHSGHFRPPEKINHWLRKAMAAAELPDLSEGEL